MVGAINEPVLGIKIKIIFEKVSIRFSLDLFESLNRNKEHLGW
jgi:hypothetical protein